MAKVDILNYISDSNILRSTYDTDTNELDITDVPQNLNSVITLGQGGGGGTSIATYTKVNSGTVTIPERYQTTGNRALVTLDAIGFTPTQFILIATDETATAVYSSIIGGTETKGVVLYASYGCYLIGENSYFYSRQMQRINAAANPPAMMGGQNWVDWTTSTNNYLYNDGTTIYFRTSDSNGLPQDGTYTWIALA